MNKKEARKFENIFTDFLIELRANGYSYPTEILFTPSMIPRIANQLCYSKYKRDVNLRYIDYATDLGVVRIREDSRAVYAEGLKLIDQLKHTLDKLPDRQATELLAELGKNND